MQKVKPLARVYTTMSSLESILTLQGRNLKMNEIQLAWYGFLGLAAIVAVILIIIVAKGR